MGMNKLSNRVERNWEWQRGSSATIEIQQIYFKQRFFAGPVWHKESIKKISVASREFSTLPVQFSSYIPDVSEMA